MYMKEEKVLEELELLKPFLNSECVCEKVFDQLVLC